MEIALQPPAPPVNMLQGHVTSEETSFMIHCHDKTFKKVTVMGDDGEPLFRVEGAVIGKETLRMRRKVADPTGCHLFDFRRHYWSRGWLVENSDGNRICTLEHTSILKKGPSAVTAKVRTTAGEDVQVEMSPIDKRGLTTKIEVSGSTIATITMVADNPYIFKEPRDRSVWRLRVAAGVDLTLVSLALTFPKPHPVSGTILNIASRSWLLH